jgi:hypothetical protein
MTVAIVSCEMGDGGRRQRCGRESSDDNLILQGRHPSLPVGTDSSLPLPDDS